MKIFAAFYSLLLLPLLGAPAQPLPDQHASKTLSGWNVRVDQRLLTGENKDIGEQALRLLESRLVAITAVVPAKAVTALQKVTIQMDLDYGSLISMQYHPSDAWLKQNGYAASLVKCVHIPRVEGLISRSENHRMPWAILHELAHAYHDQILGFEELRIMAAWKKFSASGKYESVLTQSGQNRKHYGLTDQKEFFAEMTESYFGSNDFFPFVCGELKQSEPEIFALMESIWGKI